MGFRFTSSTLGVDEKLADAMKQNLPLSDKISRCFYCPDASDSTPSLIKKLKSASINILCLITRRVIQGHNFVADCPGNTSRQTSMSEMASTLMRTRTRTICNLLQQLPKLRIDLPTFETFAPPPQDCPLSFATEFGYLYRSKLRVSGQEQKPLITQCMSTSIWTGFSIALCTSKTTNLGDTH